MRFHALRAALTCGPVWLAGSEAPDREGAPAAASTTSHLREDVGGVAVPVGGWAGTRLHKQSSEGRHCSALPPAACRAGATHALRPALALIQQLKLTGSSLRAWAGG